jgi:hypothetical protein
VASQFAASARGSEPLINRPKAGARARDGGGDPLPEHALGRLAILRERAVRQRAQGFDGLG